MSCVERMRHGTLMRNPLYLVDKTTLISNPGSPKPDMTVRSISHSRLMTNCRKEVVKTKCKVVTCQILYDKEL